MSQPDAIFANPQLAQIYDFMDPDRSDLDLYRGLIADFGATSVLDVGCGTGTLACQLAADGIDVTGVDPAAASIEVAKGKPGASAVRWICGDATELPDLSVDAATMTANVAQVFIEETDWRATLIGIHAALSQDGRLVFEVRDPARRAWDDWQADGAGSRVNIDGVGFVESRLEVTDVSLPFVSFRWTFVFERDGSIISSDSTLRFRERAEVEESLADTGFRLDEVLDAPDRPGKEFVFVCTAIS